MIFIKEYKGFLVDDELNVYNSRTNLKLTPFVGTDGYYQVGRRLDNGKTFHIRLHILYAHCFIPNPNNLECINHKDENPANNEVSNLE